jgi:hypothetical protein
MTSIIPDLLCDKFENLSGKAEAPGSQVSFRLPLRALCKILCKSGFSISRSDEDILPIASEQKETSCE